MLAALRQQDHRRRESVWTRLLGKPGDFSRAHDAWRDWSACVLRLRWRSAATTAEADGGSRESGNADPKRHDPGGKRWGSIGTALDDNAHDLQGSRSAHHVLGRLQ